MEGIFTNESKKIKEKIQKKMKSKNKSLKKIIKKMPWKLNPHKTTNKNFVGLKNYIPEYSQQDFFIQKQKNKLEEKYFKGKKFLKNYLSAKKIILKKNLSKPVNKKSNNNLEKYIALMNNKHFILPKFKKKNMKKNKSQKKKKDKKGHYSNISMKQIWKDKKRKEKNKSMVFFILSKNLDQLLLKKIGHKNNSSLQIDTKDINKEMKVKKKFLNIKTPHGNFTLENANAFSKPQIVINNFMINQKDKIIDKNFDSKRKRIQSSQNSPKTKNLKIKRKHTRSQTKKSLSKYFEKLRLLKKERFEIKKKRKKKNKEKKTNIKYKSCNKKNITITLTNKKREMSENFKSSKNKSQKTNQKKNKENINIINKQKIEKQPKNPKLENVGPKFYKIFRNLYKQQETTELKELKNEIKEYILKNNKIPETTLKYYQIIKLLGKGSFGKVYLGLQKLTNRLVAIKSIKKSAFKDEKKKKILSEMKILKNVLGHPNIIKLLEVFENEKYVFFVMEYASNGDLLDYLKKKIILSENDSKYLFFQICSGLKFIHKKHIIHRDIKLDNILLDNNYKCKICDFGVSRIMKKDEYITEQCGTPAYLAPEIIRDLGYKNLKADIWSLGILLFSIVTGNMPFKANSIDSLQKKILKGKFDFGDSEISEECRDLVKKMLVVDPFKRIGIEEILEHKWLAEIDFENLTIENVGKFEDLESSGLGKFKVGVNDFALNHVVDLGFKRELVIEGIEKKCFNHATSCYFNIEKDFV